MIHPIRKRYGPTPSFHESDVARFLWLLRGGRKSRGALAKELGVGEGSVRTIIAFLLKTRLIDVGRRGCALTKKGTIEITSLGVKDARFVPATELSYGRRAFAIVLKMREQSGLLWRDAAVKAGAEGATTLRVTNGRPDAGVPGFRLRAADAERIMGALNANEGDAVILGYGATPLASERGAWAAALSRAKQQI
ncbi:hypothetical protein COU36_01445 [Candidatus Micrarchaeota archaeon CG10_big_fil_rev_8_21_14_0_10_59_7]|nr:MAG: hypothetical protein COU36_01445 [Candidatus Micrarchaeota archaeon CG10_big_fil_rev_8_21_14_0_10_59_7]